MDHSEHMDHPGMHHPGMDDPGMDMPMCNMNMLFTWDTTNLCVVFKWWHVRTTTGLFLTMVTIIALGAGYEYIRKFSRKIDNLVDSALPGSENEPLQRNNNINDNWLGSSKSQRLRLIRSSTYALQVAYSFFLMLIFMTYNGWAMLAVTAGAFLGFYLWGDKQQATRGMACH